MRQTKTRQTLIRIFKAHTTPLSLAELHTLCLIAHPNMAYSTVFRLVYSLEKEGLIVRIDWRERGSRYEWAELPHHHHIVCQICGSVCDIDCAHFNFREKEIEKATGFTVMRHSIEFEGICSDCQKKKGAKR